MADPVRDARLLAYLAGELDAASVQRLGHDLASEPETAARLLELATFEIALRDVHRIGDGGLQIRPRTRRLRIRLVSSIAAAACLTLSAAGWWLTSAMENPSLRADAVVHRINADNNLPASRDGRTIPGDQILVPPGSMAELIWRDGTEARIAGASEVRLLAGRGKRLRLEAGTIDVDAARQLPGLRMVIEGADGRIEVVGTRFRCTVADGVLRVAVQSGTVHLHRGEESQPVSAGESAATDAPGVHPTVGDQASESGMPGIPRAIDPSNGRTLIDWARDAPDAVVDPALAATGFAVRADGGRPDWSGVLFLHAAEDGDDHPGTTIARAWPWTFPVSGDGSPVRWKPSPGRHVLAVSPMRRIGGRDVPGPARRIVFTVPGPVSDRRAIAGGTPSDEAEPVPPLAEPPPNPADDGT